MPTLGPTELFIILIIIVVLFGASRLAGIGGAIGQSVREFRKTVRDDDTATAARPVVREDVPAAAVRPVVRDEVPVTATRPVVRDDEARNSAQ